MFGLVKIAVIAHYVSAPLYKHRSKEFSERMYFMARQYDEVHILSKEKTIKGKIYPIQDELCSNLVIHKIHSNVISSNVEVLKTVRKINADAVFADGMGHGLSCLLCRKYGIPLITFVQGYEADLKAIGLKLRLGLKPTPGLLSKIFGVHDAIILRSSDRILCVSDGLVEYAKDMVGKRGAAKKIEYIPHSLQYVKHISKEATTWADEIIGSLKANHAQRFLPLMVVGVGPAKGTDIALKAHQCIVKENPDAVMILVSKTIDPKYVKMSKELELNDHVLFLESLPREHVLALLSRASIFLCPSFSEGSSFSVAEAMTLGIPVVAYENKSLRDAANKGTVVTVKTTDPRDYVRECVSLIRDEKIKDDLVQNAKDHIQPFVLLPEKKRFELICNNIDQVLSKRH